MKRLLIACVLAISVVLLLSAPAVAFTDMPIADTELNAAVNVLRDTGVIQGFPDGTFRPADPLTWNQAALMFSRTPFVDRDLSPWLGQSYLCTRGMVRTFIPGLTWYEERWQEPITRGQAARLISRYVTGG